MTPKVSLCPLGLLFPLWLNSHPGDEPKPQKAKPQGRLAEIQDLMERADPLRDDWESEKEWARAEQRLDELAEKLVAGRAATAPEIEGFFAKGCLLGPLRPVGGKTIEAGHFRVRVAGKGTVGGGAPLEAAASGLEPAAVFGSLLEPFREAEELRFEFKIVGVRSGEGGRFATDLFYQAYGRGPGGAVEQNAFWAVDWEKGEDEERPRIEGISVRDFHETSAARPLYVERTGGVIRDAEALRRLQWGGDTWQGRIDAVGELPFFGHNGIAVGDVNGDGLDDLYVATGTGIPNQLFVQNGDGSARECAAESGVDWLDDTKGVLFADADNDGDQDLFAAMGPTILLSVNDGKGRFTPSRSMRAGTDASFYSLAAADYDLDGDLDLYGVRYVKVRYGESLPVPFHDANNGPPNHLLRNDGEKGFTDVTAETGLGVNNSRFSLAASWADYDGDGDPDLYVANDFGRNNLYRNDGGRFVDVAGEAGVEDQAAGMGVSWADADLDGHLDLLVSNMFSSAGRRISYQRRFKEGQESLRTKIQHHSLGNSLFLANGDGSFRDASDVGLGVRMGRWAWGALFLDINNDGWEDIVSPNGFVTGREPDDL